MPEICVYLIVPQRFGSHAAAYYGNYLVIPRLWQYLGCDQLRAEGASIG